ncbi:MAG: NAD(P)H-hydrate dehydratase [Acidimicrobiia bacterium]
MQVVLTAGAMRAADAAAIVAGTPETTLMHCAGSAVAREAYRLLGRAYGMRVCVLAGPGNNGGDGRIAAALLERRGIRTDIVDVEKADDYEIARALERADLVIDAMFGTGFRGALPEHAVRAVHAIGGAASRVLAVDIPSGVHATSGRSEGPFVCAERTLTFQARKTGMFFGVGATACGEVVVADIGVAVDAPWVNDHAGVALVEDHDIAQWCAPRARDANKWSAAVLVVGGSAGMPGAPMMSARAALRSGAGMVWCGLPPQPASVFDPGEIIVRALAADPEGARLMPEAANSIRDLAPRFGALVVGPGLGADARTSEMVARIVAEVATPIVLDADGLNAIAGDLAPLRLRAQQLGAPIVLTPHAGEYERLTGQRADRDPIAAATSLAHEARATVLLKGPTTVVAAVDGRVALVTSGGPELATAGTGDVLSGVIAALIAQGASPFAAAAAGAHIHGRAGASIGPGLVASDLIPALAPTLAALFSRSSHVRNRH